MFVVSDAKDVLVVVRSHHPSLRQRAWVSLAHTAPVTFATQHILGRVFNSVGPGGLQWPLVYPSLSVHPPPNPPCVRAQCLGRRVMESQVPSAIPGDEVRVAASGVSLMISRDWAEFHGPGRFQISRSKPQHGGMD